MDLSMDPINSDAKHTIVLQTNDVTIEPASDTIETNTTTSNTATVIVAAACNANKTENGKHSPAAALSPSSIILSPCSDDNEKSSNGINNTVTINDEEYDEVKRFFEGKMHIIEKWLRDRATPDIQSKLHEATDFFPRSPKAIRTSSVTSDLFQQWLSSSPIQVSSGFELVFLLIRSSEKFGNRKKINIVRFV